MLLLILIVLCCARSQVIPEDANLNFTALAIKYGQEAEEFDITTEDGYILKMFHIIGNRSRPVLFSHGLSDTGDGFIIRGNLSLAVNLARSGYDVWAINHRGNRYSRRHLTLDPNRQTKFWNFSTLEFGTMDLPAAIDFIRNRTDTKVSLIGYSEGATNVLILGAVKPEYNDKIGVFIAMAPICFMYNTNFVLSTILQIAPDINKGLQRSGREEFVSYTSPLRGLINALCNLKGIGYLLCLDAGLFLLSGVDKEEFEPEFLSVLVGHFPSGTSRKNVNHLAQIALRKKFAHYDYGPKKNIALYGSQMPPEFDLRKVTMKVSIFCGKNDEVATIQDVELLRKTLPNVVDYRLMKPARFSHMDFVWGRTTYTTVLPQILEVLRKYSK